jgi:predicted adenine nucleotide alpha hydrolase (AANH) superfamily ATPase
MRILLHACCGPCSTTCLEDLLGEGHEVTLFYSDSNIYPYEEFEKRGAYLKQVAEHYHVDYVIDSWDHEDWLDAVSKVDGYQGMGEGLGRCSACFSFNLRRAEKWAKEHGFDGFATTLTVSRFKKSSQIFESAKDLEGFLCMDFKKHDGFSRSCRLARDLGLYRQSYCGCEFSRH